METWGRYPCFLALVGRVLRPTKGGRPRRQDPQHDKQKEKKHGQRPHVSMFPSRQLKPHSALLDKPAVAPGEGITAMTTIINQIRQCAALLASVAESHWSEILRAFVEDSDNTGLDLRRIEEVLSWFGGMGSLSDVCICQRNGHDVPDGQEDRLNGALSKATDSIYESAMEAKLEMR